jgi:hypothetical protein
VASSQGDDAVPLCGSDDLAVVVKWEHGRPGLDGQVIAENVSGRACRLAYKPQVTPLQLDGTPLPVETIELADTNQGTTENFPMDGYVATQAWAQKYPKTAAVFVRAIQEGQVIADTSPLAVQSAIAKYDDLPIKVTAVMAIPGFPTGSVQPQSIQRVADVMLEFGALSTRYSAEVENGALIRSMISA